MDQFTARHEIDVDFWEKDEKKSAQFIPLMLENIGRTNNFSSTYTKSFSYLCSRIALQKSEEKILESLHLAAKGLETCFLFATQRAKEAQLLGPKGKIITITKNEDFNPANYTEEVDFVDAVYLSVLAGSNSLAQLADIEMEELTFSINKSDAFFKDYGNFLKSIIKKDGNAGDWLIKTFKGTFPDQIKYGHPDYLEHNEVAHLKVWIALLGGDEQKFNDALLDALEKHKAYWSRDKPLYRGGVIPKDDEIGFFSLALTAICKLAHKSGVNIQVKSDYIPDLLVYGE